LDTKHGAFGNWYVNITSLRSRQCL